MFERQVMGAMAVVLLWGSMALAAEQPAVSRKSRPGGAEKRKAAPAAAAEDGWPYTREGAVARRWVAAFATGETAMRDFYLKDLAETSRAEKSMEARLTRYRGLRERFGKLVLGAVVKSVPGQLTVTLLDADAAAHRFVFKVQTEAPFQLLSVGMMETRSGGHGGGGFHH